MNTPAGGQKVRETNYAKYGRDFYQRIGAMGGKKGRTGGFASSKVGEDGLTGKQRASIVGAIGGRKSKRTKKED